MSHLTKEQLREALVGHGHGHPPSNARKDELIALYREKVNDASTHLLPLLCSARLNACVRMSQ